jgi:DegT/DnrJ/EryC1/StrS aminotransferase family
MDTREDECNLSQQSGRHPDLRWLTEVRAAIDWWLGQPSGTPTSSLSGSGAVAACEAAFESLHGGRPAVLLASATYAIYTALAAIGVEPGREVIVPALDWTASVSAVRALGAVPVPAAVAEASLTISPAAVRAALSPRTSAVIACHLHGVCADVPAIRAEVGTVPIVEDCAAALGSTLDERPAGTLADAAVYSLGPGKQLDAGEGGVLILRDERLRDAVLDLVAHPLRSVLFGSGRADGPQGMSLRPHPLAAVLALAALARWDVDRDRRAYAMTAASLGGRPDVTVLGRVRRTSAQPAVPVLHRLELSAPCSGGRSGAQVVAGEPKLAADTARLLGRTRLIPTGPAGLGPVGNVLAASGMGAGGTGTASGAL